MAVGLFGRVGAGPVGRTGLARLAVAVALVAGATVAGSAGRLEPAVAASVAARADYVPSDEPESSARPQLRATLAVLAGSFEDRNADGLRDAGDTVRYLLTVTNVGGQPLSSVLASGSTSGSALAYSCPTVDLAPGQAVSCTSAAYTLTQADVDTNRGVVIGVATVAATIDGDEDDQVTAVATTSFATDQTGALRLAVAVNRSAFVRGQSLVYRFALTNIGSVTLHSVTVGPVVVEPAGRTVSVTCPDTPLAPGGTLTCLSGPYIASQADVDAGSVTLAASAAAQAPTGAEVRSAAVKVSTPSLVVPGLSLVKRIWSASGAGRPLRLGDQIRWIYTIGNTGNTTLRGISVGSELRAQVGVSVSCPATALAPGASMTCKSAVYRISLADVARGQVGGVSVERAAVDGVRTSHGGAASWAGSDASGVGSGPATSSSGPPARSATLLAFTGEPVPSGSASLLGATLLLIGVVLGGIARRGGSHHASVSSRRQER